MLLISKFDLNCSNWFMWKVSHSKAVSHWSVAEEVRFLPKWTRSNSKVLAKGFKQTYIIWYNSLSQPLTFETCFSLPAFFPSRPLFSVLQYFVWPEWHSILREVDAGVLASRNTTLRFRAFPIITMEKSCVPCCYYHCHCKCMASPMCDLLPLCSWHTLACAFQIYMLSPYIHGWAWNISSLTRANKIAFDS